MHAVDPSRARARVRARHRAATCRASRSTSSRASSTRRARHREARVERESARAESRRCARRSPPRPPRSCRYPDGNGFALKAALSPRATVSTVTRSSSATAPTTSSELATQAFLRPGDRRRLFAARVRRLSARDAGAARPGSRLPRARLRARPAGDARGDHAADAHRVRRQSEQSDRHVDRRRARCERSSRRCRANVARRARRGLQRVSRAGAAAPTRAAWIAELSASRSCRARSRRRTVSRRCASATASWIRSVADMLNRVRQPFNVNCARAGGGGRRARRHRVRRREPRAQPRRHAQLDGGRRDARPGDTCRRTANFLLVTRRRRSARLPGACCAQGVIVRPVANYGLPEFLRVTVGPARRRTERFLDGVRDGAWRADDAAAPSQDSAQARRRRRRPDRRLVARWRCRRAGAVRNGRRRRPRTRESRRRARARYRRSRASRSTPTWTRRARATPTSCWSRRPVAQFAALFSALAGASRRARVVTDAGSTKQRRHRRGARAPSAHESHASFRAIRSPAPSTRARAAAAATLFAEPQRRADPARRDGRPTRRDASRDCGRPAARACASLDADVHDRIFAAVSHLPHVLRSRSRAELAARPDAAIVFRLSRRAAFAISRASPASSPEMWRDIALANRGALSREIDALPRCARRRGGAGRLASATPLRSRRCSRARRRRGTRGGTALRLSGPPPTARERPGWR